LQVSFGNIHVAVGQIDFLGDTEVKLLMIVGAACGSLVAVIIIGQYITIKYLVVYDLPEHKIVNFFLVFGHYLKN